MYTLEVKIPFFFLFTDYCTVEFIFVFIKLTILLNMDVINKIFWATKKSSFNIMYFFDFKL